MSYQSPLYILDYFKDNTEPADLDIARLKKRFLAEFNLYGTVDLTINGKSYSKDAILKQLEDLKDNDSFFVHHQIYSHKSVLLFFENPQQFPDIKSITALSKIVETPHHQTLFETLLTDALNVFYKTYLNKKLYIDAGHALVLLELLSSEFRQIVFETIYKPLSTILEILNQLLEKLDAGLLNGRALETQMEFIYKNKLIVFLNRLPNDFVELRNSFALVLVNLLSSSHNGKYGENAVHLKISGELMRLNIDDENLQRIIKNNHAIFVRGTQNNSNTSSEGTDSFRIIWFIVIALVLVVRMANTCSGPKSSSFDSINSLGNFQSVLNNYTTVSFKDYRHFILYELKKDTLLNANKVGGKVVLQKNENPLFPNFNYTTPDSGLFKTRFINASTYDVLLFQHFGDSILLKALPAKDSLVLTSKDTIDLSFYFGRHWMNSKSHITLSKTGSGQFKLLPIPGYFEETPLNYYAYFNSRFLFFKSIQKKQKQKSKINEIYIENTDDITVNLRYKNIGSSIYKDSINAEKTGSVKEFEKLQIN